MSEIQGGERRYSHVQYGIASVCERDYENIRYHRKRWVPRWLWKLLATPDFGDVVLNAMKRAEGNREERIAKSLHALNQKSPTELTTEEWKKIMEDEL